MVDPLAERWAEHLTHATPDVVEECRRLLGAWQDSVVFVQMHALLHACLLAATLKLGEGNKVAPLPDALRNDAADLRIAVDTMALFLDLLADRIDATNNGGA